MKTLNLIVLSALLPFAGAQADMVRIHQGDIASAPAIEGQIATQEGTQIPGDSDLKTCWIYGNLFVHLKNGKTLYKALYAHGEIASRIPVYAGHIDTSEPDCERARSILKSKEAAYSQAYLSDVYLNAAHEVGYDPANDRKFQYVLDVGADASGKIDSETLKRIYQ